MPLNKVADYFISDDLRSSPITYRKAFVLVNLHLALIGLLFLATFITFLINEGNEPSYIVAFLLIGMLYIFKWTSNFVIVAHLNAVLWFLCVGTNIPISGGVHCEDMVWMMLVPIIVLIISNQKVAFFWLIMLDLFYITILIMGKFNLIINKPIYTDYLYTINYMVFSCIVFLFLYISESNRNKTIILLKKKSAQLEAHKKAILENTEALKAIEEKLLKTNKELETFAYSASHDLKEPLRMVKMYTELLKRSFKEVLENNQLEFIGFITDGVTRMQNLLDDLLLYSRLGKNTEDTTSVNLNERLLVVKNNLRGAIKDTEAEIISDELPQIRASVMEISHLFQNIIANAIKFRKQDVPPKIKIEVREDVDEYVFSIEDNGIGIKQEYQEQIFELFKKLHSSALYDGSGVGLSICKKIVETMGGRIWLTSTEKVGTTFFFSLPKEISVNKSRSSSLPQSMAA